MCGRCGKTLLNFVAPIHTHDLHLSVGKNDVDDAFAKRIKEEPTMTAIGQLWGGEGGGGQRSDFV